MRSVLLAMWIFCSTALFADNINRPDSYNYNRGVEAIQNNNVEEALQYLNKEIEEHPDNGYAYAWIALVRNSQEEYGKALTASNLAVKRIPSKDKEYLSFAYSTRARVYLCLEDTIQALKDCSQAINIKTDESDLYNQRAQIYYEQKKYDLTNADYKKMIMLDEGDVIGYMGLGRNANAQERYIDAIKQFDYVLKLAPEYSYGYSFRAESYIGLKKYKEAIDDVITALRINNDTKAFYEMQQLADSVPEQTIARLKIQKTKEPHETLWIYYLGITNERAGKYKQAIDAYKEYFLKEQNATVADRISICYSTIGQYENALEFCNQAIALDSAYNKYLLDKSIIEDNAGMIKDALDDITEYIKREPEHAFGYHKRGWIKDKIKDYDGAIEDYTMAVMIDPKDAYSYMCRGNMYRLKGEMEKAMSDFRETIRLDSVPDKTDCAHYAYFYLGEKEKAVEIMNAILKKNDKGNFYDAACLYSIMGEKEKSIGYLRKALELGFRRFAHIKRDRDLNNIRNEETYKALMEEYENKHKQEISDDEEDASLYEEQTEKIPFVKEGDLCKVKCTINGLPLHFIFDTGASNVSLSSVEATFMVKNGYLSSSDVVGKQRYLTADGNVSEGTVINLKEVKFGTLHLDNIKASVVRNQAAPLLLGQSVLNKLGKIEIDNDKRILKISYKLKK